MSKGTQSRVYFDEMDVNGFLDNVLIVVVLYKRQPEESPAFASAEKILSGRNGCSLLLYDNSPSPILIERPWLLYKHDPINSGVSRAFNTGAAAAGPMGKQWMLLLDQDTELDPRIAESFARDIARHPDIRIFTPIMRDRRGIVSPYRQLMGKGYRFKKVRAGRKSMTRMRIVNSGMLVSLDAFRDAGGFDERFPLDMSDVVFCEKLSVHDRQFVVIGAECRHNLSSDDKSRSKSDDLMRFQSFRRAMFLYKTVSRGTVLPGLSIIPRGMFLAVRHWDLEFIRAAFGTSRNRI